MPDQTAEDLSGHLFNQAVATMETAAVWLGGRLGWYRALHDHGPLTAAELATLTDTSERYATEWLEQQAVAGVLDISDGRYALPAGHAEVLLDADSLLAMDPLIRQVLSAVLQLPALAQAYASGGGVGWQEFGPEMSEAQGDINRPILRRSWPTSLVPQVPVLHERLQRPARVAEIGCGHGWSAVALAQTFPDVLVDGFDVDEGALAAARRHAVECGVADRVSFHRADVTSGLPRPYDVLVAIECLHDMPYPVEVLAQLRAAASSDALVVVLDEAADEILKAPGDELQRCLYGFSLLICLPDSMSHPDSAATGAVMRPAKLDEYARAAGFSRSVPVELADAGFWRLYLLEP